MKTREAFVIFIIQEYFSRTWEPPLWTVHIKVDSTPVSQFLWKDRSLNSVGTLLQVANFSLVVKIWDMNEPIQIVTPITVKLVALYVNTGAMKSCSLRTDYCLSWKHICSGLYLLVETEWGGEGGGAGGDSFLSLPSLRIACLWCSSHSGPMHIQLGKCFLSLLHL